MVEIRIAKKLLRANDEVASEIRRVLAEKRILAINIMGSPGSGKTSLLEQLCPRLAGGARTAVVEGDLETARDAERMEKAGVRAVQMTTGKACHLDAGMIRDALSAFDLDSLDILFIENVGNLVCPASFDLGEDEKLVVASVTEGDDKAEKYPPMFSRASLLALNKVDLLPYVDFRADRFSEEARKLRPGIPIFQISCRTGEGIEVLAGTILRLFRAKRGADEEGRGEKKVP